MSNISKDKRLWAALALVLLAGCEPNMQYKCVDGRLYERYATGQPYWAVDSRVMGFGPTSCVSGDDE